MRREKVRGTVPPVAIAIRPMRRLLYIERQSQLTHPLRATRGGRLVLP
jgi:hypothetical protein